MSVVTVSFRDPEGLRATRASVLEQEYPGRIQHVVIDGGSGPEVRSWLEQQRGDIVWVSETDQGIYDAMNKGIAYADGDVLWFMNSADTFHRPTSVAVGMGALSRPREQWGFGQAAWQDPGAESGISIHGPRRYFRTLHALGRQTVPHQATFFGAELLTATAGFDASVGLTADQALMMRCARLTPPIVIDAVLCDYDTSGVSTQQTRSVHWDAMRRARRSSRTRVCGVSALDDLLSRAFQGKEWLQTRAWTRPGVPVGPDPVRKTTRAPAPAPQAACPPRRVSVIIPTHGRDDVLPRAIDSALQQGAAVQEVLVVDDLGRASTRSVVESLAEDSRPVRYLDASRRGAGGPASSRNLGAAHAGGDVLAFLDDDDRWLPGYLERAVSALGETEASGPCCVVTWTYRSRSGQRLRGSRLDPRVDHREPAHRYWGFGVTGSNLVVDAATFASIGGYDPQLWSREDYEIFVRLLDGGRDYALVTEELVEQDAGSSTHLTAKSRRGAQAARIYLDKHGPRMTRQQRRGARRHYHSMLCGADTPGLTRARHRAMQAWLSSRFDWRMMTLGRLTGDRPPDYR